MKVNNKELKQVFKGISNKEEKYFNIFYEKYNKLIYSISFSILKNEENSKDVMQNVFTKIYNLSKDKFPTNNESSWLYSVTKNETIMFLRKTKNEISIEDIYEIEQDNKELEKIIDIDTYKNMIKNLNDKEKEIVSLKILSQMSFKEISKLLNIPIATAQWRYYKAINSLKIVLANLSMFVISIFAYIFSSKNIKKVYQEDEMIENEIIAKDEEKTELENSRLENSMYQNQTISQNNQELKSNINEYNYSNIFLGFSFVFLIITVIFTIIFIKNQQKLNKKSSK